jgi:hypothetical protein
MTQFLQKRPAQATRRWAHAVLVLFAGTFAHAAWSSQVAGTGIGRVATVATPAPRPAPAPTTTSTDSGKRTTRAASGASRAGSAATR